MCHICIDIYIVYNIRCMTLCIHCAPSLTDCQASNHRSHDDRGSHAPCNGQISFVFGCVHKLILRVYLQYKMMMQIYTV